VSLTSRSPILARRHTVVVHDFFVLDHPEWYSAAYVRTHAPVLTAQLRTARGLVAVSPHVADQVRHRFPRTPVIVAPNAPSDVFSGPSKAALPDEVRDVTATRGVRGFFFAVGSRDPRKNFDRLVAAYATLPAALRDAFPLVISGGRSEVFATSSAPESPDVRWIGYVDDDALAALYSAATAVVVPSLEEGFGLPLVEALAAGGRLVVSDIPTFRWIADDAALFFDPESATDIARGLAAAVDRPPPGATADRITARFNWDETAHRIAEFASSLR
jgi:glycosyltransferase involved in cell wall biosynthesis